MRFRQEYSDAFNKTLRCQAMGRRVLGKGARGIFAVFLLMCTSLQAAPSKSLKMRLLAEPEITAAVSTKKTEGQAGINGLHARFLVPCSPEDALNLLWDIDRFQSIFPSIQRLEVKRRTPVLLDVKFGIDVKVAWVDYTLRRTLDKPKKEIHWQEIAGDLNYVRGHWTILPTENPDVAELVYSSFVEVSAFIPTSMIRDGALEKVKSMPDRVRPACLAEKKRRKARAKAVGSAK